jgi:hypothetical protein
MFVCLFLTSIFSIPCLFDEWFNNVYILQLQVDSAWKQAMLWKD